MEHDDETKEEPCIVCGKTPCEDGWACLRTWIDKAYPGHDVIRACKMSEEA